MDCIWECNIALSVKPKKQQQQQQKSQNPNNFFLY